MKLMKKRKNIVFHVETELYRRNFNTKIQFFERLDPCQTDECQGLVELGPAMLNAMPT